MLTMKLKRMFLLWIPFLFIDQKLFLRCSIFVSLEKSLEANFMFQFFRWQFYLVLNTENFNRRVTQSAIEMDNKGHWPLMQSFLFVNQKKALRCSWTRVDRNVCLMTLHFQCLSRNCWRCHCRCSRASVFGRTKTRAKVQTIADVRLSWP